MPLPRGTILIVAPKEQIADWHTVFTRNAETFGGRIRTETSIRNIFQIGKLMIEHGIMEQTKSLKQIKRGASDYRELNYTVEFPTSDSLQKFRTAYVSVLKNNLIPFKDTAKRNHTTIVARRGTAVSQL